MNLMADDLVVASTEEFESTTRRRLVEIASGQISGRISSYGKTDLQLRDFASSFGSLVTPEEVTKHAKTMFVFMKYAKYVAQNATTLLLPLFTDPYEQVVIRNSGIELSWDGPTVQRLIGVKPERVAEMFGEKLTYVSELADQSNSYLYFAFNESRLGTNFIGDSKQGSLLRAFWQAKRSHLESVLGSYSYISAGSRGDSGMLYALIYTRGSRNFINPQELGDLRSVMGRYDYKPDISEVKAQRTSVLRAQQLHQSRIDAQRHSINAQKFGTYWDDLKSAQEVPQLSVAGSQWDLIPMKTQGLAASRTWGIEIETVRADQTSRPPGWDSKYDGSLPDGGSCDCSCDSCYDDDHCEDVDSDCYRNNSSESREFVSPILHSFNSAGLRQICTDLGTDPNENPAAGIHVHVGASDLTVSDVSRLLLNYSAVERFITPLLYRRERNYCRPTSTENLRWWLAKVREHGRLHPDSAPTPADVISNASPPDGRYVDVNLQSLTVHGTVEFRAMGPWYDYTHLTRWAWFAREMVNVSKLGIDQSEWTSCKNVADVVALLRKYGTELPSNELFGEVITADLDLSVEQDEEMGSVVG